MTSFQPVVARTHQSFHFCCNEVLGRFLKMAASVKLGFVGGGHMSQAIATGFIKSGLVKPENIIASAITEKTLKIWKVKTK